ncbi:hypothetical protein GUITHDRAFT_137775 [Guillardia theta CCMP2712]|uniref:SET domain-containing protein n=1 Tax=Guillardia theta (strain CCMP2712) TaxID=905079 RepID=L1JGG3_GUITC|nr:hypothetical protein GUITHDRAFT_137775 [Guillardia theta CCMP2712]EKX47185.1 hypothetical protein GUITHDRAFT_137775 [Guillardia theta CCMP2712]|eukprot:XP_005834165.1 hypothetical protein GUITHDRAFT_137775 [Guillardia theta CCMP2712]
MGEGGGKGRISMAMAAALLLMGSCDGSMAHAARRPTGFLLMPWHRQGWKVQAMRRTVCCSSIRPAVPLCDWLETNGANGIGDLVTIARTSDGQLGMFALQELHKDQRVLSLPASICFSEERELEEEEEEEMTGALGALSDLYGFSEESPVGEPSIVLQLLRELSKGQQSRWFGYLQALPAQDRLDALWLDEGVCLLDDQCDLLRQSCKISRAVDREFKHLDEAIFAHDVSRWAKSLVLSRAYAVDEFGGLMMLLPGIDFANHNPHVSSVRAGGAVEVSQVSYNVWSSYGNLDDEQLALMFGFTCAADGGGGEEKRGVNVDFSALVDTFPGPERSEILNRLRAANLNGRSILRLSTKVIREEQERVRANLRQAGEREETRSKLLEQVLEQRLAETEKLVEHLHGLIADDMKR